MVTFPPQGGGVPPTKEFFMPATAGTESYTYYQHPGYRIDADGEVAYIEAYIPDDYSSLIQGHLVILAVADVTNMSVRLDTYIAAHGEGYSQHQSSGSHVLTVSIGCIYEIDISARLTLMSAGDYVCIKVSRLATQTTNASVLGVHIKYS